jgi:hypothetical protein
VRGSLLFPFFFAAFLHLHCSAKWIVESVSTIHGSTGSNSKQNVLDRFWPSKIKKSNKIYQILCFI